MNLEPEWFYPPGITNGTNIALPNRTITQTWEGGRAIITANYDSMCSVCSNHIWAGSPISRHETGHWVHDTCLAATPPVRKGKGKSRAVATVPDEQGNPDDLPIEKKSGTIIGYRRFKVHRTYPHGTLLYPESVRIQDPWTPREARAAVCANGKESYFNSRVHDVPAPAWGCSCGYYLKKEGLLCEGYDDDNYALATCKGWGKVIEHESGYRCQYAYPSHIAVFDADVADRLAEAYGVPVEVW